METDWVLYESGLLVIEATRADVSTTWTAEVVDGLNALLPEIQADPAIGAIMLTGGGMWSGSTAPDEDEPAVEAGLQQFVLHLGRTPKPVIAAVRGLATGTGLAVALASDLIIAAESALFEFAGVDKSLGTYPTALGMLAARVGYGSAARLVMMGERLNAFDARDIGIVTELLDDGIFAQQAHTFGARLADRSAETINGVKHVLRATAQAALETQLQLDELTRRQ